tara:strand:- start:21 stop:683 length:663 start_codon:yes stop_codon:yes gene_type:complete
MEQQNSFYTPNGIHVYVDSPLSNKDIDLEKLISKVENTIPSHLLSEVEMVIVGWFDEFEERKINAFYKDGTLHVSNIQEDMEDMYDDVIHEIAHSLETPYGYEIYGDKKIEKEFLRKRKYLYDTLWKMGYKIPLSVFMDPEYNEDLDLFLYEKIGYDKLSHIVEGIFISAYAPTSLREYFATGFTEYYLDSNHEFLSKVSPALYQKLSLLQKPEKLDNST